MDTINAEKYLAQGEVITKPDQVLEPYRSELMRLMSSFVDSELAASAGFSIAINYAPGITERVLASRITAEKAEHAERVLHVMADFGTDVRSYQADHQWDDRVPRHSNLNAERGEGDRRLSVFYYPLLDWSDAVVMNVLQGLATTVQMTELTRVSYAPLAATFREIAPREAQHTELGLEGLAQIVTDPEGKAEVQQYLNYWRPRVAAGFGRINSWRFDMLSKFGLRHTSNEELLAQWENLVRQKLSALIL